MQHNAIQAMEISSPSLAFYHTVELRLLNLHSIVCVLSYQTVELKVAIKA